MHPKDEGNLSGQFSKNSERVSETLPTAVPNLVKNILQSLIPEKAAQLATVNKAFNEAAQTIWERNFKRQFPHRVNEFKPKTPLKTLEEKNKHWREAFKVVYKQEYLYIKTSDEKKLFSIVKDCDLDLLKEQKKIEIAFLYQNDRSQFSLLHWVRASGKQSIADYFYACAKEALGVEGTGNQSQLFLLAVSLNQGGEILKPFLGNASINPSQCSKAGLNALHLACKYNNVEAVALLLEKYPTMLESIDNKTRQTPLLFAAANGHSEVVSVLLNANANPTIADKKNRRQLLHVAAMNGHLQSVKHLVEASPVLLNQKDAHGQTPIQLAKNNGHADVMEYLISKGATDNDGVQHKSRS